MTYVVTYIMLGTSEPREHREPVETGDPDVDIDEIVDRYAGQGDEVIHVADSTGKALWAAPGIDL